MSGGYYTTVADLIAELQKMPADSGVAWYESEWQAYHSPRPSIQRVYLDDSGIASNQPDSRFTRPRQIVRL